MIFYPIYFISLYYYVFFNYVKANLFLHNLRKTAFYVYMYICFQRNHSFLNSCIKNMLRIVSPIEHLLNLFYFLGVFCYLKTKYPHLNIIKIKFSTKSLFGKLKFGRAPISIITTTPEYQQAVDFCTQSQSTLTFKLMKLSSHFTLFVTIIYRIFQLYEVLFQKLTRRNI